MSGWSSAEDVRTNRTHWDAISREYQTQNATQLNERELAWGVFARPEEELGILGDVGDQDVLELGCGAAQWSIFLARRGARAVGIDLSGVQLAHAGELMARFGASVPIVQGSATELPFRDQSFDIVFCDHGAMSFADPDRTIPEAARVLRPSGLFAFSIITPLFELCFDPATDEVDDRLHADYFTLGRSELTGWGPGPHVEYQRTYGGWVRLFRQHRLQIDDLIETRARPDDTSTYWTQAEIEWSKRWPSEHIWKLRKEEP
jgi:ubiquinone/menaquinone biosynthesis C-methylase UbiE